MLAHLQRMSPGRYVSPCDIATVQSGLGEKDAALKNLERCYDDRSWEIIFLKQDPAFKRLHGDPRFDALLKKMNLV